MPCHLRVPVPLQGGLLTILAHEVLEVQLVVMLPLLVSVGKRLCRVVMRQVGHDG